jgi:hypothetical protein
MRVNRRLVLGTAAATAFLSGQRRQAVAAKSTPVATTGSAPGYAIARIRALSSPELNAAIVPDVLATFLPRTAALPGYAGYVFSEHLTDPAATITLTLLADAAAAAAADEVAREYVGALDPRLTAETPLAEQGPVRIFEATSRPVSDLPPFLHGCRLTMRIRRTAPGVDPDDLVARVMASDGLAPLLAAMPGFALYCWIQTEGGRTAINIWETEAQLMAGNDAIAAWVAANTADTSIGEPVVHDGVIIYADIPGFI